jgi:microcystin-dependent protein
MLFQVITENGVKKIKPLTADTGTGAPVGSYLMLEKKSNPQGYLYCDGSTFDSTAYPALYQYLGTNVLPDFREFSPVGAEQNTTNVYDASTNPNGTIHDHDVYTEGESKDDQVQDHTHKVAQAWSQPVTPTVAVSVPLYSRDMVDYATPTQEIADGRHGTVTRGKRKAVFVYIKATSGLTENQQENVLNTINDNLSYSTTEHKTGKKWIDGKDIWSCVFPCSTNFATTQNVWTGDIKNNFTGLATVYPNIDTITLIRINRSKKDVIEGFLTKENNGQFQLNTYTGWDILANSGFITLEYTKTT